LCEMTERSNMKAHGSTKAKPVEQRWPIWLERSLETLLELLSRT